MLQGKRTRRIIAATLLTVMLSNTLAPTVSYALTSGPTAPEATSFEPVDTTDLVNTQTGDFTYNIPLLEVPGPEGGYPLSLSYHAGIQPDQDASWVGLGWALNPGAITRNVNSYPDDWHDVTQVVRDYWSGGATKTFGVNIGLPLGPANVSFGLTFANDTYRGYGVGADVGFGIGINSWASVSIGFGAGPYGGPITANLGLQLGDKNSPVSGSLGVSTDFNSVSGSGGIGVDGIGFSLSTSGSVTAKAFGAGASVGYNNNAGRISTSSRGFFIPLGPISLSWNYTRYWSDETSAIKTHGALYMQYPEPVWEGFWKHGSFYNAFDVYHLHDNPIEHNIAEEPDVRKVPGGTFPDNDVYQITAQGIGGTFRPYVYQEELYMQSIGNGDLNKQIVNNDLFTANVVGNVVTSNFPFGSSGSPQSKIHFRFVNDFSNSYRQAAPNFTVNSDETISYNYDNNYQYGNNDGIEAYNATLNKLAGSRNIEYFTNNQVISGDAKNKGFINIPASSSPGFVREDNFSIGGFSVTNESGVTYHYALPAIAYDEVVYSENMPSERPSQGHVWNRVLKPAKYAYTWYLTAITGPDFVDVSNNGYADDSDWGYWVNFEYGKWTAGYSWRNPAEGYHRDLDTKFQNYSKGKKELYYLNAIKTRSHAAIFEKNIRYDGKGTSANSTGIGNHDGSVNYVFDATSKSVLQLDKVYLLTRQELSNLNIGTIGYGEDQFISLHRPELVIDKYDINPVRTALTNASLKIIDFTYDNSLCGAVTNSYDYSQPAAKMGKLTLKSVQARGKQGAALIPPISFNYELPANEIRSSDILFSNHDGNMAHDIQTSVPNIFEVGDVLKVLISGDPDYCTVTQKYSATSYKTVLLGGHSRSYSGVGSTASTTKTPNYAYDYHDVWGMFKSDFDPQLRLSNENMARNTTVASSKNVDVWSLRSIQTSLGATIEIKYQCDKYRKAVLNEYISLILQQQGSANVVNNLVTFNVLNNLNIPIANYFTVGQDITPLLVASEYYRRTNGTWRTLQWTKFFTDLHPTHTYFKYTISAIAGNSITVNFQMQPYAAPYQVNDITDIKIIANLRLNNATNVEYWGGGLRVNTLSVKTTASESVRRTTYVYSNIGQGISSGVIPYQPQVFDVYDQAAFTAMFTDPNFDPFINLGIRGVTQADAEKYYKRSLYSNINYLLAISRELPPPAVMYEYVTVVNHVFNPADGNWRLADGTTTYQFEVFNSTMIGIKENTDREEIGDPDAFRVDIFKRNMSLKDYTTRLGLLKRMTQYDDNNRKLTETINKYWHDDASQTDFATFSAQYDNLVDVKHNNLGVVKERFANSRTVWYNSIQSQLYLMSMREEYPVILKEKISNNFVNGTSARSETIGFDYYSGAVTKTVETDVYGNRMMTEVIPAYRKYSALGMKAFNGNNKNMLTQQAATYLYKVSDDSNNTRLGVVNASVETWSNTVPVIDNNGNTLVQNANNNTQGNVWRMQTVYSWMPDTKTTDGLTAYGSFPDFNWNAPSSSDAGWKVTSQTTLYDVYSHSLEAKDINGNYAASKMGYNNAKVLISGVPVKYNEMTFTGTEDNLVNGKFTGDVLPVNGTVVTSAAHTGQKSLQVPGGQQGFTYTLNKEAGKEYLVTVWVKNNTGTDMPNARINMTIPGQSELNFSTSGNAANGWYQIMGYVPAAAPGPVGIKCINNAGNEILFDDFRVQPVNATTTAYVYDNVTGELTHILDNNNLYTRFEYDAAGRLIKTYREKLGVGEFKRNEYQYNISNQ